MRKRDVLGERADGEVRIDLLEVEVANPLGVLRHQLDGVAAVVGNVASV